MNGPPVKLVPVLCDTADVARPLASQVYQDFMNPSKRRLLHPISGLFILGLDWLLLGGDVASLSLLTPILMVVGFFLGGAGTLACQRVFARESWLKSLFKGFCAGVLVGFPLPVAGTFAGGIVLTLSGLAALRKGVVEKAQEIVRVEITNELVPQSTMSNPSRTLEEYEMVIQCMRCGTENDSKAQSCLQCKTPIKGVALLEEVDRRSGRPVGSFLIVLLCSVYLLNPFLGLDLLPDNLPLLGNLDDAGATFLLLRALSSLGWIDISGEKRLRDIS